MQMKLTAIFLLVSPWLCQVTQQTSNEGNFLYTRDPVPWVFRLGERYPNREESEQCRPIRLRITRNSRLYITNLVTNGNGDIYFQSSDARIMTSRMQTRLNALARIFRLKYNSKIRVLKAWTQYSSTDADPNSLHYEGRTVQVQVNRIYVSFLLRTAIDVGFDWVTYESTEYVRLSVIPDACDANLDMVFMLDQSGSVGHGNHRAALRFIHDVSAFYNISTNETQIGMVTYSTFARVEFALNTHQTLSSLQRALMEIPYRGGFTATAWALFFTRIMLMPSEGFGARPESEGIPKIAVLLTDGRSNLYPVSQYAAELRNAGVQVFTVGIGSVHLPELLTIASDPAFQHVFLLKSYSDAPYFVDFLSYTACDAPAVVTPGENTTTEVDEDHFRYFQTFCPAFSHFVMIEEIDIIGTCSLYASTSVQNPGPLSNSTQVISNEDRYVKRRFILLWLNNTKYVYVAVRGRAFHNKFTVIIWDMIFMEDEYNVTVVPGVSSNQSIFNVTSVLQPNNATFTFSIQGGNEAGYFSIGLQSGIVTLNHTLNETQSGISLLTIVARNSEFSCHRGRLLLRITVVTTAITLQDFPPAQIRENATVGTEVAQAMVNGGAMVLYSLEEGPGRDLFTIDPTSGVISVGGELDFEAQSSYNLTVVATSSLTNTLFDSAVLEVEVLDINEAPLFTNSCVPMCQLFVEENEPNSTVLGTLTISDPDLSSLPNGMVVVTIENVQPPGRFSLIQNGDTVAVVKNEVFDRETASRFLLTLRVTDGGDPPLFSTLSLRVIVTDVNDNAPEFIRSFSLLVVTEGTPNQTVVARYEAVDRDAGVNAEITYSVVSVITNITLPFEIDPATGTLIVSAPLDFETRNSYIISVMASNPDGLSSVTATTIVIGDDNDNPPLFNQALYNVSVTEGDPVGAFVVLVGATDADFGLRGTFEFSLLPDGNFNNTFQISSAGNITLSNSVDREVISMFKLTVAVTDEGVPPLSSLATVIVRVEDINDNPPVFTREVLQTVVNEDSEPMDILTVTAFDSDDPLSPNSQIVFSLDPTGNHGGVFNLTQVDNNNAVLQLTEELDFETQPFFVLRVTASDRGSPMLSSTILVIINVTNADEAPPVISNKGTVRVSESAPLGFRIAELNVPSTAQNVSIEAVSSAGGSGASGAMLFDIDQDGPFFFVAINGGLDFETSRNFTLTILASDGMPPDNVIYLTVEVVDVNELPPVFEDPGNFTVEEEQPSGTLVGQVTATDGDTGPYSGVMYSIVQDNAAASLFSIDATSGVITTARVLDREQLVDQNLFLPSQGSTETINVMAADNTVPFRSAVVSIPIALVDINDNSPVIQTSSIPISVLENEPAGSVVYTVVATDRDIGTNEEISFTLDVVGLDPPLPFEIDNAGVIRTTVVLDAENTSSFTLSVIAADNGQHPRNSSVANFTVLVRDVNDNVPMFTQDSYEVSIPENTTQGNSILTIQATDLDLERSNSEVTFTIVSFDPPDSQNVFSITSDGPNSASISIAGLLDFENIQQYNLVVEAVDNGIPSLSSRANVTINILDVDETPPMFINNCSVNIREDINTMNNPFIQCLAVELQDGTGSRLFSVPLTFRIASGNINNTFRITNVGTIIIQEPVDREVLDLYQLLVVVTDPSGQSSSQVVNITIIDVNDNAPVVTNPNLSVFVSSSDIENSETNFFTVMATDADIGSNAELNFIVEGFLVNVNGTSTEITVTVSNSDGTFPTSTVVTLEFETPCFLQDHTINSSSGQLESLFLCQVSVVPDDVNIAIESTLELECSVLANFIPTRVDFMHNSTIVPSEWDALTVDNVTFEQGGEYACVAVSEFGMLQSENGIVRVQVPPEIVASPEDIFTPISRQFRAQCMATGLPQPTFTWSRVLQQSGSQVAEPIIDRPGDRFIISGGSLIIVRTEPGDMGVYICTASNTVGNTSASFRLSVFGSASLVQAQITSFSNGVAMATALCHDTNQQGFEMAMTQITGTRTSITDQDGDNLCESSPCSPSPCRNSGVCELQNSTLSGFECDCGPGYTGPTCEVDINECLEAPCQFGGTCIDSPEGSFTCTCSEGYAGRRCQYRDVCSNSTCPSGQMCIHTITNMAGFICQNLTEEEAGTLLRVAVAASNSSGVSMEPPVGSLDDQVNTFQENREDNNTNTARSSRTKRMAENTPPVVNSALVTACEARFIPDPFSSQEGHISLLLVWACPEGVSSPPLRDLDAICSNLFATQSVENCSSPSGLSLKNPSTGDLLSTSFTFTFVMVDSKGIPLSGSDSLNLLEEKNAMERLEGAGYLVSGFSLVVPLPVTSEPSVEIAQQGSSVAISVGVSLAAVVILIFIVAVIAGLAVFLYSNAKRKKIPVSSTSTPEHVYHLDNYNLDNSYEPPRSSSVRLQDMSRGDPPEFDDPIYSSGTYAPPEQSFHTQSTKSRRSSSRMTKIGSLKKRTDSTDDLLADVEGEAVADEPHESPSEDALSASSRTPPVPPRDGHTLTITTDGNTNLQASGVYMNGDHMRLGAMGNAGERWDSRQRTHTLFKDN